MFNGFQKNWSVQDWSPDDTKLLDQQLRLGERVAPVRDGHRDRRPDAGQRRCRHGERGAARAFTADGRGVFVITNRDSEFEQLRRVDLVTGAAEVLTGHIPWDIEEFDSQRRRPLPRVRRERRRREPADGGQPRDGNESLPPLPDGSIGRIAFDRTGKRLALSLESPQSPRDVFVLEVEHNAVVRYTQSEAGPVDPLQFVPAELVRYPTFDRANGKYRRSAGVHLSAEDCSPGPHPVLIDIHGGPESRRPCRCWNPFTQFLVREMGFAVITPNVRGSTRLRQDLSRPRQRRRSRGFGQGHRRAAGVDRRAEATWTRRRCSSPAAPTAATCRWRRW